MLPSELSMASNPRYTIQNLQGNSHHIIDRTVREGLYRVVHVTSDASSLVPVREVNQCRNLVSLSWTESLKSHQNIRNLIESDETLRNLIRIFGTTLKSLRESSGNP